MLRHVVGLLQLAVACTPTARREPEAVPTPAAESAPVVPDAPPSTAASRREPEAVPAPAVELAPVDPEASTITATLLGHSMGKPPLRFYNVRLTLVNRRGHAVWLVFPDHAEDALPAAPVFVSNSAPYLPFGGKAYDGAGGRVVEVTMYGAPGFLAFHLPPHGRVVFDDYSFDASESVDGIDAWEVATLKVDDKLPLERWLPYEALSAPEVRIAADTEWINLDSSRSASMSHRATNPSARSPPRCSSACGSSSATRSPPRSAAEARPRDSATRSVD
ncbi:hypothetical protein OV079_50560 [Nannocystis pusilla]|uniref:Uncharacterized protein n=1 Tax=Nannocystis pusilla TaxID=889268 RepID=A0A9X3F913_9BACT|nr:hypothetical protein [Nannocystis pusilla]MCY1013641.1 hypothetical protein [Nannocystis pusilla]